LIIRFSVFLFPNKVKKFRKKNTGVISEHALINFIASHLQLMLFNGFVSSGAQNQILEFSDMNFDGFCV